MTTEHLLSIAKDRGLTIELREGRPVIVNGAGNPAVTAKLLAVLTFHREKIIKILEKENNHGRQITRP